MAEHVTATLARLESQVEWWNDQAAQVEQDRRNLRWLPPGGAALAVLVAFAHIYMALAIFGVAVVAWAMGMYMTTVRRSEFRENLQEAQADLSEVQATIQAQRTGASSH